MNTNRGSWSVAVVVLAAAVAAGVHAAAPGTSSRAHFQRRILPIFRSAAPSSCAECHLGGVDLKEYIAETEEQTFRSLRDQGLVDLAQPDRSRILKLIEMSSPRSSLVNRRVRQQEYEAFRDWIRAAVKDRRLAGAPPLPAKRRRAPDFPNAVIRHGRIDRVLASFEQTVWAQQQRCAGCHSSEGQLYAKHHAEHGDRIGWMVADDPQATLTRIIERHLIDPAAPVQSLLLRKPTLQVSHGGGLKMMVGDAGYKSFRRFIEDYAAVVRGAYRDVQQLPAAGAERFVSTQFWLKLENTDPAWGDRLLSVDLYPWDAARDTWSTRRVATSDRGVYGKGRLWQHNLDLVLPAKQPGAALPDLTEGRYLVQVYVDQERRLEQNWQQELRKRDFYVGDLTLEPGWSPGYGKMKVVNADTLQKGREVR